MHNKWLCKCFSSTIFISVLFCSSLHCLSLLNIIRRHKSTKSSLFIIPLTISLKGRMCPQTSENASSYSKNKNSKYQCLCGCCAVLHWHRIVGSLRAPVPHPRRARDGLGTVCPLQNFKLPPNLKWLLSALFPPWMSTAVAWKTAELSATASFLSSLAFSSSPFTPTLSF